MSKRIPLLLSLTAMAVLSACDPAAAIRPPLDPATTLCSDTGENQCKRPNPDDLTAKG